LKDSSRSTSPNVTPEQETAGNRGSQTGDDEPVKQGFPDLEPKVYDFQPLGHEQQQLLI